jgi:hypothetical protein
MYTNGYTNLLATLARFGKSSRSMASSRKTIKKPAVGLAGQKKLTLLAGTREFFFC